jgi:D-alanyl-D-alanine dipeptidase
MPLVLAPLDEPMVPVAHERIAVLENYRKAGWEQARAGTWLRRGAFDRLVRVAEALPERWGICVFDAWRPLGLQEELYEAAYGNPGLPPGFISVPDSDPTTPPPHLTGGTVDCSLTLDDIPLGLGTAFDDFTRCAQANILEDQPSADRELRRWLYFSMRTVGFVILDCEWWHFEYGTRRWASVTGRKPLYGPASPPV